MCKKRGNAVLNGFHYEMLLLLLLLPLLSSCIAIFVFFLSITTFFAPRPTNSNSGYLYATVFVFWVQIRFICLETTTFAGLLGGDNDKIHFTWMGSLSQPFIDTQYNLSVKSFSKDRENQSKASCSECRQVTGFKTLDHDSKT